MPCSLQKPICSESVWMLLRKRSTLHPIFQVKMLILKSRALPVGHHLIAALRLLLLCQIVPLWTSLVGLAGPLTGVILSRTSGWTSVRMGLERQLTFRPLPRIISVHRMGALFKSQQDAVRGLKLGSRRPSRMFQMTGLEPPACGESSNRRPNKREIFNSSQVLLLFSTHLPSLFFFSHSRFILSQCWH